MTYIFYWFFYRKLMALAHRFNWHYAPPFEIEHDIQRWCRWCGMRYTTPNPKYFKELKSLTKRAL